MDTQSMITWLGPAAEDMTEDQIDRFAGVWRQAGDRYPDPDDQDLRDEVLSAAVQYLLGDTTLAVAASRLASARAEAVRALEAGKQIALLAIEDGLDEQDAAKALGVARKTMRRAAGKEK